MRSFFILSVFGLCLAVPLCVRAQENITITTYFPAPFGEYNELNVHSNLTVHDIGGSNENTQLSVDNAGNLVVTSSQPYSQLIFNDSGRPFSYWQAYSYNTGATFCAPGYAAPSYLKSDKTPANPASLPPTGYIVCLRSWE